MLGLSVADMLQTELPCPVCLVTEAGLGLNILYIETSVFMNQEEQCGQGLHSIQSPSASFVFGGHAMSKPAFLHVRKQRRTSATQYLHS